MIANRMRVAAFTLVTIASTALAARAGPSGVEEAGIVHGALVVGPAGAPLVTVAQGGPGRGLPAISPDGMHIAFVQATDKRVALADIVVVTLDGRVLSRVTIEPVRADIAYTGMQSIESLCWISPGRIAVSGSINPSQSQYYVIDAAAGKIVDDLVDDGMGAAFSPDGLHVAALSGSPHYGPAGDQTPALSLDGRPVWQAGAGATLASAPQFSPDGARLAWVARDAAGRTTLDVWSGAAVRQAAIPAPADATLTVRWAGGQPVAELAGRSLAWSLDAQGHVTPTLVAAPATRRETLVRQARAAGVNEADFWGVK